MAFYKKSQLKSNQKWYPRSIVVGDAATTNDVADRLAEISTVSRSDTYAVLMGLASALKSFMKEGRSVKLDGVGTFYYTADASKQGVDTPEEQANQGRARPLPAGDQPHVQRQSGHALAGGRRHPVAGHRHAGPRTEEGYRRHDHTRYGRRRAWQRRRRLVRLSRYPSSDNRYGRPRHVAEPAVFGYKGPFTREAQSSAAVRYILRRRPPWHGRAQSRG